jgi:DNA/RNA-binding domain of Phe-tRNA-synthetase-like protein
MRHRAEHTGAGHATAHGILASMTLFRYESEILEQFPGIVGGVIHATGVTNGATPPALAKAFADEQAAVRIRIGDTPLSELPALAAWRRVFRGFGVDPTQYRSAAEALLRRLTKQGELPSIGTLVDLANLVSIRHALPVAVLDLASVSGGIAVRLARGDERWTDLGSSESEHPEAGEVIFADEADVVVARRWCWRQSAESAAREGTTDILITVEGHHDGAPADVAGAMDALEGRLRADAGQPSISRAILTRADPAFG